MDRALAWLFFVAVLASTAVAEVVLEEDFESPADYRRRWGEHSGWSLVEADVRGKKSKVLDVNGGDVGLGVRALNFRSFDYEADFRILKGYGGFVFRARDSRNLQMMQFGPANWCPHTRNRGEWNYERIRLPSPIAAGQWMHVKFEVRGNQFTCFLAENAEQMKPLRAWEGKEPYRGGRLGFRCFGGEQIQVDNIRVATSEPITASLEVSRPSQPRMAFAGQPLVVKVELRNTGWKAAREVRLGLSLPEGFSLAEGEAERSATELASGAARAFSWKLRPERAAEGIAEIRIGHDG